MNINTNALLNTLMSKVDSSLKAKIEKLSVDGKVDLSSIAKDKGIATLLSQLFKDVSTGTKNKAEVVSLLENSKQSLKFKDISTDIKQIINLVKVELKNNPELDKLTNVLRSTLLDIKNIDEKILKSTFQNSGVFMESKLAKSNESVSDNLKNLLGQLNDKLKILNSLEKTMPTLANSTKMQNISNVLDGKNSISQSQNLNATVNISSAVKSVDILQNQQNISASIKSEIKADVQDILKKVESAQHLPKIESQLNALKIVSADIQTLEHKLVKLEIKNEITLNLKELTQQAKNNILNNSFQNLNRSILFINDQLENIKSNNITEIKNDVKKLDIKLETINNEKNIEVKMSLTKDLIENTSRIIEKIGTSNIQELLKNNISNLKNISGDLKTVILQIKEIIEQQNNSETVSKELKNNVDKILSQIDYYQLSSYSSNSNHSYLSFLQDDLEDVDIKFNNENNNEFSCMIHLSLKEKGDLKILLQLDKKSGLNINIGVEQTEFKMMIQDALQKLRVQINSIGLSLISLNVFDLENESNVSNELKAYGNNQNLDFGLDIKV